MTAYDKTITAAKELGFRVEHIDDDCFDLIRGEHLIEVSYNRFSPSAAFENAIIVKPSKENGRRLGSYGSVQKEMRAIVQEELASV